MVCWPRPGVTGCGCRVHGCIDADAIWYGDCHGHGDPQERLRQFAHVSASGPTLNLNPLVDMPHFDILGRYMLCLHLLFLALRVLVAGCCTTVLCLFSWSSSSPFLQLFYVLGAVS